MKGFCLALNLIDDVTPIVGYGKYHFNVEVLKLYSMARMARNGF